MDTLIDIKKDIMADRGIMVKRHLFFTIFLVFALSNVRLGFCIQFLHTLKDGEKYEKK